MALGKWEENEHRFVSRYCVKPSVNSCLCLQSIPSITTDPEILHNPVSGLGHGDQVEANVKLPDREAEKNAVTTTLFISVILISNNSNISYPK